jgi:ribonucleotide monophosphatase NagD (HAD superfamily)
MIAAIEAVTTKKVELIVGKPSPMIIETALEVMGLKPDDCILIGDRLETDIKMGKESGIATGIVLTGVTDEKTLKESSIHPDFIFQSIADLQDLMVWR